MPHDNMFYESIESPIGTLHLLADEEGLRRLTLCEHFPNGYNHQWQRAPNKFSEHKRQLEQYFAGKRTRFDLLLAPKGTDFQIKVWQALTHIPFGATRSYADIAKEIDNPKAFRAIGMANNLNPIPIIIPCHRVIGSDGKLTGYRYGLEVKHWLLEQERSNKQL